MHKDDPLAQFELKSEDFYEITRRTLEATKKFTNGKSSISFRGWI